MNCTQYQEWINQRLGGALERSREDDLARHLESCAECRAEETAWRLIDRAAAEAFEPPGVDDVTWGRVWKGVREGVVEESQAPPEVKGRGLWWATAAAAAVVLVAAVSMFFRPGAAPEPDRLAMLREGAARIESVQAGSGNYIPVVSSTQGDAPVVYIYEVGQ